MGPRGPTTIMPRPASNLRVQRPDRPRLTLDQGTRQSPARSRDFASWWLNYPTNGTASLVGTVRGDVPKLPAFEALERGSVAAQLPPGSWFRLLKARGSERTRKSSRGFPFAERSPEDAQGVQPQAVLMLSSLPLGRRDPRSK
jgi:hypothetical protein